MKQAISLKSSDVKQSLSVDIFSPESISNNFESNVAIPFFMLDSAVL